MIMVSSILLVVAIYLLCGLLFAIPFVIKGISKVDENAHGGSIGFRIILIPGVMVFWPLLLKKWMKAVKQTNHD